MLYQTFESQVTHEIQSLKFCYVEKLKSGPPLLEKSNFLNLHREITEYMTPPSPKTTQPLVNLNIPRTPLPPPPFSCCSS